MVTMNLCWIIVNRIVLVIKQNESKVGSDMVLVSEILFRLNICNCQC